jgi:PAS domain S-box-containing protein
MNTEGAEERADDDVASSSIVVIDDDAGAIRVLGATLSTLGRVRFTTNPLRAQALVREELPDLILLDVHMPDLDGFELCRTLKADELTRHIPVVFVTRFDEPAHEMRGLDMGAADFISKPYTPAVLRARVRNLLQLKHIEDEKIRMLNERWRLVADARVAEAVRTASDAIIGLDGTNVVNLANAAAGALFGMAEGELIGRALADVMPGALAWLDHPPDKAWRVSIPQASGSVLTTEVSVSRGGSGATAQTLMVLRDVTAREQLEAETRARLIAEESSRAKTRMIGVIAHEMGQPLNVLIGFTQLMQALPSSGRTEQEANRLDNMALSASVLRRLLDDLLEFARCESGALALSVDPVDVAGSLDDVLMSMRQAAQDAGVQLHHEPGPPGVKVLADGTRLYQCLSNLLSNAIKYNRPGGEVVMSWVQHDTDAEITLRDTGIGMTPAQLKQLFEPFNRLGQETGQTRGTGLGLYVTAELIKRMGGRLHVTSQPGVGSCFSMRLPMA